MPNQDFASCICRDHEPATFDRPALFLPVILIMFASLGILFALMFAHVRFGVQLGSIIPYSAFVFLATFSAQRGQQPYFFECPIVHQALPRLIRRHYGFMTTILVLETTAPYLTRYLPSYWLATGKDGSPFGITLSIVCVCIAAIQIFTNRSLLERAHLTRHTSA